MSWHYQLRKQEYENGRVWYDVVECYENPHGWTEDGIAPAGETPTGVIEVLEQMLADVRKYPVLGEETT